MHAAPLAGQLLLDTHVWLWWTTVDAKLGPVTRAAVENAREVYFSAVTAWEIAIKQRLGKLKLSRGVDLATEFGRDGFLPMPFTIEHALLAASLPPHHKDPFDRMLVAQAQIEGLTLVTADPMMSRYDVPILSTT